MSHVLTTPISYITVYPQDAFSPMKGARLTFNYSRANAPLNDKWLLWSYGPDLSANILVNFTYDAAVPPRPVVDTSYYPSDSVPSLQLRGVTYDPTNGTESSGDLYRFKQ
jgi:hypothetical protein